MDLVVELGLVGLVAESVVGMVTGWRVDFVVEGDVDAGVDEVGNVGIVSEVSAEVAFAVAVFFLCFLRFLLGIVANWRRGKRIAMDFARLEESGGSCFFCSCNALLLNSRCTFAQNQ